MPRHASTHAAGVVITRDPATEYVPLSTNDGLPVTQFNMVEIERLGLLKMDFLGLRTLTVIHDTELAVRRKDPDFRIANLDYDDPDTYAMLAKGETEGIFQLESTGMTQVLVGMRPKTRGHYRTDLALPPRPDGLYSDLSAQPQGPVPCDL